MAQGLAAHRVCPRVGHDRLHVLVLGRLKLNHTYMQRNDGQFDSGQKKMARMEQVGLVTIGQMSVSGQA